MPTQSCSIVSRSSAVRFEDVFFLEVEDVDEIHAIAVARHGGSAGTRDPGLLESAVMAPQAGYYGTLTELAAALCHGLAKNHPYIDGNKRVAISAAAVFLAVNGYPLRALDANRWEAIMVGVASGTVSRDELAARFAEEIGDAVPLEA